MRAVGEGRLPNSSASFERHIDRCLGCRACEQVCPAGVEYGQLLESARAELFNKDERGFSYKLLRLALRHVWLHPARLRFMFALLRFLRNSGFASVIRKTGVAKAAPPRLEFALALLESSASRVFAEGYSKERSQTNSLRSSEVDAPPVLLFTGCVGEGLFARVNRATERVLAANDFSVKVPNSQVCCGALHAHAGDLEGARKLARQNIEAFRDAMDTPVVTNAGGCGAMLASYGHLLENDEAFASRAQSFSSRVRDVSKQLQMGEVRSGKSCTNEATTYDASCHLLYGQHAGEAPLELLSSVSNLNFVRLEGSERCCGGAGIYNLLEPDFSRRVLNEKLSCIATTGARILATGNPGCQMQIGAGALLDGMDLKVCHPIELLDESYRRAGFYQ